MRPTFTPGYVPASASPARPWWLADVEAVRAWSRVNTTYDRVNGYRAPTSFALHPQGYTAPCSALVWVPSVNTVRTKTVTMRLTGAKGMPHVPVVTGRYSPAPDVRGDSATFAPKVLCDAIGEDLTPEEVGVVLGLPRRDVERLALIGALGGDGAIRAALSSEYAP